MRIVSKIVSNGHGALSPSYVVIHETANPGASALNHVNYWRSDPTYAVHYVGDWTGIAYHCVPDNRLCWQVGNGNDRVVGIELCHATNKKDFDKVWTLGVEWAAWMLKSRGWGTDRLLSHYDCTKRWGGSDHTDPIGYFSKYGKSWSQFKQAVAAKMKGGDVAEVQLYAGNCTAAQMWRPTHNADGTVTLVNKACGKALDVKGAKSADNTAVQAYKPNGSTAQKWTMVQPKGDWKPQGAAPWEFEPKCAKGKRLDVKGSKSDNGTPIQIYKSNGSNAQRWAILDRGDGYWMIYNIATGKALDVKGGGK